MPPLDFDKYAKFDKAIKFKDSKWPTRMSETNQIRGDDLEKAETLLQLGILNWRRGNYDRSEQLIAKAKEISSDIANESFLAQCYISLALVKTRLDKIDDAIDSYRQAVRIEPDDFHLWNNLGNLYIKNNQPNKALSAFKEAIRGNSKDAMAWNGLANAHYQTGNVDEAIYSYERALEFLDKTKLDDIDELSPELKKLLIFQWLHLAMLYTKKCQFQKAIDAYQKTISLEPENAEIWNELGALYIKMEAYEKSIEALTKVIELDPDNGEAFINLGYAYTRLGKHRDSIPFFLKSIERLPSQQEKITASQMMEKAMRVIRKNTANNATPKNDEIQYGSSRSDDTWFYCKYDEDYVSMNHTYSIYNIKRFTDRTANRLVNKNISNELINSKSSVEPKEEEGEVEMAGLLSASPESHVQAQKKPDDPFSWIKFGNNQFKLRAYENAIKAYKSAIEIEPTFGQPYNNLALIYFIQGDYNNSIQLYQKSLSLLSDAKERAVAWNGLGNVYRRKKDYENAWFAYQKASELDKKDGGVNDETISNGDSEKYKTAEFWNDLGKLFFKNGFYDKAATAFQKAIRLEPSSWPAYGYLARSFTAQGQFKEAVSTYYKSIDIMPNDKDKADAWNRLGDVYRKLNDYDSALKAYKTATKLINGKFSLINRTRFSLLSNCVAK